MNAKLVGLNQLKNELFSRNMDTTFVDQLINEALWKNTCGFHVQEKKDDVFEIYNYEGGQEVESFSCLEDGTILKYESASSAVSKWLVSSGDDFKKKLTNVEYLQLKEQLIRAIEEHDSGEACQMLEAKEKRHGII